MHAKVPVLLRHLGCSSWPTFARPISAGCSASGKRAPEFLSFLCLAAAWCLRSLLIACEPSAGMIREAEPATLSAADGPAEFELLLKDRLLKKNANPT